MVAQRVTHYFLNLDRKENHWNRNAFVVMDTFVHQMLIHNFKEESIQFRK